MTAPAGGLGRSAAVMAAGTVLSRLTGFGRVFALAYALGFDRLADSYNLANTTPNIIYELVLGGVLSATLVPVFVDLLATKDEDEAWRGISAVVTVAVVTLLALTALAALAAPLIIRVYTLTNDTASADDQRAVATALLRMFAPQVALLGIITLTTALLNARRRFAAPMFSPVLANLVTIGVLLAFPHVAGDVAIDAVRGDLPALLLLGLGTTSGYLVQAAVQLPPLRRAGVRLRPVWDLRSPAVRSVVGLAGWTVGVVAANQLALWVVLVLANRHRGDLSAYQAAFMFFQLPHAVVAVSIMTALLPDLARAWSLADRATFAARIATGVRATAVVLLPAAVGYALLATPVVRLALEHGRLRPESAETTGALLALFALGLPGYSSYLLAMRAFQAMRDTRTMFVLYAAENAVNIVLALALHPVLGVRGLAVAYAAAYTVSAVAAFALLRRRTGVPLHVAGPLVRTAASAAVMGACVAVVARTVGPPAARVGAAVGVGATVYVLAARVLGVEDLTALLRIRRRPA